MAQRYLKISRNKLIILKTIHKINQLPQHLQQTHQKEVLIQIHTNTHNKPLKTLRIRIDAGQ